MVDINTQKEQFSMAYVHALCSVAGFSCTKPTVDDNSIDLNIKSSNRPFNQVEIQLKATANLDLIRGEYIHFPLPIKNYNELRGDDVIVPRYLICLILPDNEPESWINQGHEQLTMKKCAYWFSLKNHIEAENTASVTVKIPLKNILTPESLKTLVLNEKLG